MSNVLSAGKKRHLKGASVGKAMCGVRHSEIGLYDHKDKDDAAFIKKMDEKGYMCSKCMAALRSQS